MINDLIFSPLSMFYVIRFQSETISKNDHCMAEILQSIKKTQLAELWKKQDEDTLMESSNKHD